MGYAARAPYAAARTCVFKSEINSKAVGQNVSAVASQILGYGFVSLLLVLTLLAEGETCARQILLCQDSDLGSRLINL